MTKLPISVFFTFQDYFLPWVSNEIVIMFCLGVQDQEGRRVSFELCPFLASCVMGSTENRAASTHGCAVEHGVAPKSLKGFGHLSVMLKGKKKQPNIKKKIPNHNCATTLDIYKTYVLLTCRKDWWNGTTAFLKWHSTNNYLKCCWCWRISLKSPWPEIKQSHHWKISQNYVNA